MHKREVWFNVGPTSSPSTLVNALKDRGLRNYHNRPFMNCLLEESITDFPIPEGVRVSTVEDYSIFEQQPHPIHGLVTTARKRHIFQTYRILDQQSTRKHWMFIAEKAGKPAGMVIVYIDNGIAGIYDVEVIPSLRGQGIGSVLLQHACAFARDAGVKIGALAASEQGSKFYPRFGFCIIGRYPTYYYSQTKQKRDAQQLGETW